MRIFLYQDNGTTQIDSDDDDGEGNNFYLDFTPTVSAFYKLKIDAWRGYTGAYTLNFYAWAEPDAFEPDNSSSEYTSIFVDPSDQVQNHSLSSGTDEDWFRFPAIPGKIYRFYSTSNTDTRIYLYEDDGTTLIDSDDDDGDVNNYLLDFVPTANAYYKLKVNAWSGEVGWYEFHCYFWVNPDSYEPDNSSSQYTTINPSSVNYTQQHSIHSNSDRDWYRFYGVQNRTYSFISSGYTDTWAQLYSDDGTTQLAYDDDGAGVYGNFKMEYKNTGASQYFKLQVGAWNGLFGAYGLDYYAFEDPDTYEPDNSATAFTTINVRTNLLYQNHSLHNSNDEDWYRFWGVVGMTYNFYSTGDVDTRIYLYDDAGTNQLDWNDDDGDGLNYSLSYTVASTGYFKLKVSGYSGTLGAYGFYFYYTAPADAYEPDNSATNYQTLAVTPTDQTQMHTIHIGTDQDWYRFYAYTGRIYKFYSTGYSTDTIVYLYQEDGTTQLATNDDGGIFPNFSLQFAPTINSYYKLKVVTYGGATGYYEFNYSFGADPDIWEPDDSATNFTSITPVAFNHTQNHTIHSNTDQDWYRFYGYTGRFYTFYSTGNTDVDIYLYQDNGIDPIDSDWDDGDGNNYYLQFAPTVNAYYKLMVRGHHGGDAGIGAYYFKYSNGADPDTYEPDNSPTQYTSISVTTQNQSQNHTLHTDSDKDWFRFYGTAGRQYLLYVTSNADINVFLYSDDAMTIIDYSFAGGLMYTLETSAYYKLSIESSGLPFDGNNIGAYVFHYYYIVNPDAYEPDNSTDQSTYLHMRMANQPQNHTLHSGTDQDWYMFSPSPGRTYTFFSEGNTDTRISLYQEDGTTLIESDDDDGDGLNFSLQFAPSIADIYKLKVDGWNEPVGAYIFNYYYIVDPDAYEPDNSATQYTSLNINTVNQIQAHTLHAENDEDWFHFQGVAGRIYTFYSTGNTDCLIYLYQENGTTQLAYDDDSNDYPNFYLQYAETLSANYTLKVRGFGDEGGPYGLNYSYTTALEASTNVTITKSGSNVTVSWNAVIGASSYKIEGSNEPYTGFTDVGTSATTSWSAPASAARKFYRVVARN